MWRTKWRRIALITIALIVIVSGTVRTVREYQRHEKRQAWFALQSRHLRTIQRLEAHPPDGWTPAAWKEAVIALHNVWGNVMFHPDVARITPDEMRELQQSLDQILDDVNKENSFACADRVYDLLLSRERHVAFIIGYRDEFRAWGYARQPATTSNETTTTRMEGEGA